MYNPQRVMRQFSYDQGTVSLTGELSTSDALLLRRGSLVMSELDSR